MSSFYLLVQVCSPFISDVVSVQYTVIRETFNIYRSKENVN